MPLDPSYKAWWASCSFHCWRRPQPHSSSEGCHSAGCDQQAHPTLDSLVIITQKCPEDWPLWTELSRKTLQLYLLLSSLYLSMLEFEPWVSCLVVRVLMKIRRFAVVVSSWVWEHRPVHICNDKLPRRTQLNLELRVYNSNHRTLANELLGSKKVHDLPKVPLVISDRKGTVSWKPLICQSSTLFLFSFLFSQNTLR